MEGDPFCLIEGMMIAGHAVGATMGYLYVRSEYPHATLNAALDRARRGGPLGAGVLGSGRAFDIEVRMGAGAYICGEETAMLESLEGRRGVVRAKPPLPAIEGLFGAPTVDQQRGDAAPPYPSSWRDGAAVYRRLRRRPRRAGRCRCSWPATCAAAA